MVNATPLRTFGNRRPIKTVPFVDSVQAEVVFTKIGASRVDAVQAEVVFSKTGTSRVDSVVVEVVFS